MNTLAISLIGDPTLLGWSLTAVYALSAWFCVKNARRRPHESQWFWGLLGGLLFCMAINKQADLHQVLRDVARPIVLKEGWQDYRRVIQEVAILFLTFMVVVVGVALAWWLGPHRDLWGAGGGAVLVALFVLLRASTFYHISDVWLKMPWVVLFLGFLEWLGPLLVIVSARRWARKSRRC